MLVHGHGTRRKGTRSAGFTLAEVLIAVLCLALFLGACLSAILFNRVAAMKAKEQGIATDFLIHYVETIKGLPFEEVLPGRAINPLLDGTGGAPNIRIPADNNWVSVNTSDFFTFHPDLTWLASRDPRLQVVTTTQSAGGTTHDKHLKVVLAWDSPVLQGSRLQCRLDLVRTKDL